MNIVYEMYKKALNDSKNSNYTRNLKIFEDILLHDPYDPWPFYILRNIYSQKDYNVERCNAFLSSARRITQYYPHKSYAFVYAAEAFYTLGDNTKSLALQFAYKALEISIACLYELENIFRSDFSFCAELYKKAIELDPKNGCFYNNLGDYYIKQNIPEKAIDYIKKSIILTPDHFDHVQSLGECYHLLGNHSEVENILQELKEKSPSFAEALRKFIESH